MSDAHEVYKELSSALNDLSNDLVKGLISLRAVSSDNKADVEKLEKRFERAVEKTEEKAEKLKDTVVALEKREAAMEKELQAAKDRISKLEKEKVEDAKAKKELAVENTKGKWALWVAFAGGGAGILSAIGSLIEKLTGG